MRRANSPVQKWIDSLSTSSDHAYHEETNDFGIDSNNDLSKKTSSVSAPNSPITKITDVASSSRHSKLTRDPSLQSDSSHCSSVESLLELRKADPEAILLELGFGGSPRNVEDGPLLRIPRRFLQPSKLQGIDINEFIRHQQECGESSEVLGYRGLTGSPYVAASEIVQKIMERLHEHEFHDSSNTCQETCSSQEGKLSLLSPDNRCFLERPRSKSPDMRNKRIVIGEKSFGFGKDGGLIELDQADSNKNISEIRESNSTDLNANSEVGYLSSFSTTDMEDDRTNDQQSARGSSDTMPNMFSDSKNGQKLSQHVESRKPVLERKASLKRQPRIPEKAATQFCHDNQEKL